MQEQKSPVPSAKQVRAAFTIKPHYGFFSSRKRHIYLYLIFIKSEQEMERQAQRQCASEQNRYEYIFSWE
jgi:hypothetical protein